MANRRIRALVLVTCQDSTGIARHGESQGSRARPNRGGRIQAIEGLRQPAGARVRGWLNRIRPWVITARQRDLQITTIGKPVLLVQINFHVQPDLPQIGKCTRPAAPLRLALASADSSKDASTAMTAITTEQFNQREPAAQRQRRVLNLFYFSAASGGFIRVSNLPFERAVCDFTRAMASNSKSGPASPEPRKWKAKFLPNSDDVLFRVSSK